MNKIKLSVFISYTLKAIKFVLLPTLIKITCEYIITPTDYDKEDKVEYPWYEEYYEAQCSEDVEEEFFHSYFSWLIICKTFFLKS